jgi:hypothetical protein
MLLDTAAATAGHAKITGGEVGVIAAVVAAVTAAASAGVQFFLGKRTLRASTEEHEIDRITAVLAEIRPEILSSRGSDSRVVALAQLNSLARGIEKLPPDMRALYATLLGIGLRPVAEAGQHGGRYTVVRDADVRDVLRGGD